MQGVSKKREVLPAGVIMEAEWPREKPRESSDVLGRPVCPDRQTDTLGTSDA